jgi:hypothetical protein
MTTVVDDGVCLLFSPFGIVRGTEETEKEREREREGKNDII